MKGNLNVQYLQRGTMNGSAKYIVLTERQMSKCLKLTEKQYEVSLKHVQCCLTQGEVTM